MADGTSARLAVLIDADNASPSAATRLLAEVARYGTAHVKRAYGDWTGPGLQGWKDQLLTQSIQPVQQFAYTSGKNGTDAAMIIDAMDLLYTGGFDGFCLVSSDSDFTRLASRIREAGLTVYGFGQHKAPGPFVAACDKFIYIENLTSSPPAAPPAPASPARASSARRPAAVQEIDDELAALLRSAVEAGADDDGWAHLGYVGHIITQWCPGFDPRSYGYAKLGALVQAAGQFAIRGRSPGKGKPVVIYIRDKSRPVPEVPKGPSPAT